MAGAGKTEQYSLDFETAHTVREACRKRRDRPCIYTYERDMVTVRSTHECVVWCPLLNKLLDREEAK